MNKGYAREKELGEEALKRGFCVVCRKRPIATHRSSKRCEHCAEALRKSGKTYRNKNKDNPKFKSRYLTKAINRFKDLLSKNLCLICKSPIDITKSKRLCAECKNKENARLREWKKNNPEKVRAQDLARRARKNNTTGKYTASEWKDICNKYDNKCLWCGRKDLKLTVDHVVPLAKGGTNSPSNLQPLCAKCNSKKFTKILDFRPFGSSILEWT